jgi:16S rRNA (adenine1518-N6/adenine1519-N6)-dimethyltransferase
MSVSKTVVQAYSPPSLRRYGVRETVYRYDLFDTLKCRDCSFRKARRVCAVQGEHKVPEQGWLWNQSKKGSIRNQLKDKRFRPKKSMGQNFMEDESVLRDIVEYAGLDGSCVVVEVGPGTGAMTKHILGQGTRVYAIEKDDRLFHYLNNEFGPAEDIIEDAEEEVDFADTRGTSSMITESLTVLHDDVLKVDLAKVAEDARLLYGSNKSERLLLMANLPYNITRDFLLKAMPMGDSFAALLLMLQHEVAIRLIDNAPGKPDWRAMNIIVQYYCDTKYVFRVDRFKYTPVPKVDGAVVEFKLKTQEERLQVPSEKDFISLVKRGFLQRRKMLSNSLRPLLEGEEIQDCLVSCGLSPDARAQNLSLEDFVALSWAVHEKLNTK